MLIKPPERPAAPPDVFRIDIQIETLGIVSRCAMPAIARRSLLRADALMRMGNPHQAYEVLTKDVDLTKPETYRKYFLPEEAMLLPAMVFRHLNQPEPALRALDALAEAAPAASERSLLYVSTRAGVLRQLGRDEEALDAYERTLALLGDSSPGNRQGHRI